MTHNQQNKHKQLRHTTHSQENKSDNALLIYSLCMAGLVIVELTALMVFVALLR